MGEGAAAIYPPVWRRRFSSVLDTEIGQIIYVLNVCICFKITFACCFLLMETQVLKFKIAHSLYSTCQLIESDR